MTRGERVGKKESCKEEICKEAQIRRLRFGMKSGNIFAGVLGFFLRCFRFRTYLILKN